MTLRNDDITELMDIVQVRVINVFLSVRAKRLFAKCPVWRNTSVRTSEKVSGAQKILRNTPISRQDDGSWVCERTAHPRERSGEHMEQRTQCMRHQGNQTESGFELGINLRNTPLCSAQGWMRPIHRRFGQAMNA